MPHAYKKFIQLAIDLFNRSDRSTSIWLRLNLPAELSPMDFTQEMLCIPKRLIHINNHWIHTELFVHCNFVCYTSRNNS